MLRQSRVSDFTLGRIDREARRPFVDRNQVEPELGPPLTAEEWATVLQGIYLGTVLDDLAHMEEVVRNVNCGASRKCGSPRLGLGPER